MLDRRQIIVVLPLGLAGSAALAQQLLAAHEPATGKLAAAIEAAEASIGGRIGFAVAGAGLRFSHRGDERFPMASTFKMLLVAAILERIDRRTERLDRAIPVQPTDILGNSPVSEKHIGSTATVAQLCEAAIIYSDNTAANLLLPVVGGPAGLTAFLRRTGDRVTRLDRYEPMLNEAILGDPRDTTSPNAIAATWTTLLLGNALSPASRNQLTGWLVANTTGGARLRAGLPKNWRVGDKTGTGANNSVNDIAIVWPSPRAEPPVVIASLMTAGTAPLDRLNQTHSDLARAVATTISG